MTTTTGGEAIAGIFSAEGVECIFGIPGATEVPFVELLERHPEFRYVLCLHEQVAVGMAEGYARTSGKVGVLNLHTGTGLAAGLSLLSNARQGRVPLVVTVGQQDTRLLAEEPAMSDDLVAIARPFTKWATEVQRPEDLPVVLRRVFATAQRPPMGPVMVSVPLDLLGAEVESEPYERGESFTRTRPDERAVAAAAHLLATARRPVAIIGDGISRRDALDEMVRLAELVGARVYHHWMSDVDFPTRHPLYMGDFDTDADATCDLMARAGVIVVVGAPAFQQAIATAAPLCPLGVPIIQIDDDPWEIGKNLPAAASLEGDIRASLAELNQALAARLQADDGALAAVRERTGAITEETKASAAAFARRVAARRDDEPIAVERLMEVLVVALPPEARVVDDCWSYSSILRRVFSFSEPKQYQRSRRGGAIGGGLPIALGVKLAEPDRPVVCVTGDGSAMWSIQSLWNVRHDDLPIVVVVLSNRAYRQVRLMRGRMLGEGGAAALGTSLSPPDIDFSAIAAGLGIPARRVTRPGEVRDALGEALQSGQPRLLDFVVDASLTLP
jgi:benzoylformate decarboxylase